jgi:hypothetical protein
VLGTAPAVQTVPVRLPADAFARPEGRRFAGVPNSQFSGAGPLIASP